MGVLIEIQKGEKKKKADYKLGTKLTGNIKSF